MADFRVFQFGYQGQILTDFVLKVTHLNALVCDIRYRPFSRVPMWRKAELEKSLGAAHYRHIGELGNENYQGGDGIRIADLETGLEIVRAELERRHIVLMCVCRNPSTCHRRQIVEALAAHGVKVEELFPEPQGSLNLW